MQNRLYEGFIGSLVADAVAMPIHWYYDRDAMDRDYGAFTEYVAPRNPHPDSILWRSHYIARNPIGEILHDQAQYWGERGVHYHQFLPAGGSTLNFQLAVELHRWIATRGGYDPDAWLERYIAVMHTPGWHNDTYVEEIHRGFFDKLARGKSPQECAIDDVHIGGLAHVPALVNALHVSGLSDGKRMVETVLTHVRLTHDNRHVAACAEALTLMLLAVSIGQPLREALAAHATPWLSGGSMEELARFPDREIVGRRFSPACYLPDSFKASIALCWKYSGNFDEGILANARCGGDNCHRGAVVGALLGAANGVGERWLAGLCALAS